MKIRVNELNSTALAYIGDAVYELYVRKHVLQRGTVKSQQLHDQVVHYVTAPTQAKIVKSWLADELLTKEEEAIVRRGRNAKQISVPKNISIEDYRYATAFEALIGYHYLNDDHERLQYLITDALTQQ